MARAERPDALVLLALRVLPVSPASPVPKASRVIPAGRDLAGPPATPSRAPRELRARRVCPEAWDLEAHQAPLAPQEPTE